jgi:hypothetical protein
VLEAIPPLRLLFFKVPGVEFVQEKAFELVLVASAIGQCLGPFDCLRVPVSTHSFFMRWLHLPVLAFFDASSLFLSDAFHGLSSLCLHWLDYMSTCAMLFVSLVVYV